MVRLTSKYLDRVLPPKETSNEYSHAEKVKIFHEMTTAPIAPPPNAELMRRYVASLSKKVAPRRNSIGGAYDHACFDITDLFARNREQTLEKYPAKEVYKHEDKYYKLTPLKSYPFIYGMQQPHSACETMLQFFRFLSQTKHIRRLVALQVQYGEKNTWEKIISELNPKRVFYNKEIKDYHPFTFENAMSILALFEPNVHVRTVFHCYAGHGRTGSVMYLLLLYFKCKKDRALLAQPLLTEIYDIIAGTEQVSASDHDKINATWLADEYGYEAADEFYKSHDQGYKLRSRRINIANQAIANTLQLYYPDGERIGYMQYIEPAGEDEYNLHDQKLFYADPLPKSDRETIVEMAIQAREGETGDSSASSTRRSNGGRTRRTRYYSAR